MRPLKILKRMSWVISASMSHLANRHAATNGTRVSIAEYRLGSTSIRRRIPGAPISGRPGSWSSSRPGHLALGAFERTGHVGAFDDFGHLEQILGVAARRLRRADIEI